MTEWIIATCQRMRHHVTQRSGSCINKAFDAKLREFSEKLHVLLKEGHEDDFSLDYQDH